MQGPWIFVFTIMVTGFLVVAQIYAILPLIPAIALELDISEAKASFLTTAFGLAYAFGFFIFGPIADKIDKMRLLVAGVVALAAATLVAALATTYTSLVVARILQGLAAASFPATALALVSEKVSRTGQPFAISMLGFAFLSSAPLSQFIVGSLALSLSSLLGWAALLYAICAVAIYVTGAFESFGIARQMTSKAGTRNVVADGHYPPVAALIFAPATLLLCFVTFHAMCQFLAGAYASFDPQFLRLVGFPPLFLCFLAPTFTKWFGPAITATCGLGFLALGMLIGGLGFSLVLASITVSAGVALAVPGLIAAVTFWSGDMVRARALATYTFFLFAGASIAPILVNVFYQINTSAGFFAPAMAALLAAATLYLTRPRRMPFANKPSKAASMSD